MFLKKLYNKGSFGTTINFFKRFGCNRIGYYRGVGRKSHPIFVENCERSRSNKNPIFERWRETTCVNTAAKLMSRNYYE